jgi:hypothetical protein
MHPWRPGPNGQAERIYNGKQRVTIKERGSEPLTGEFEIMLNDVDTIKISYDESASSLQSKLRDYGFLHSQEIEVTREGYCPYGCKWIIRFIGVNRRLTVAGGQMFLTNDPMV